MYTNVVFDLPINQRFTYEIPESIADAVQPGVRVLVPFGPRKTTGYVVELVDEPPQDVELKAIADVLDTRPLITDEIMRLCEWISSYYLCGLGEVLRTALPAGLTLERKRVVQLIKQPDAEAMEKMRKRAPVRFQVMKLLQKNKKIRADVLQKKTGASGILHSLLRLQEDGYIRITEKMEGGFSLEQHIRYLKFAPDADKHRERVSPRATKMLAILEALEKKGGSGRVQEILRQARAPSSSLKRLIELGVVETYERHVERDYYGDLIVPPAPEFVLTAEQTAALETILPSIKGEPDKPFLIHGVTGSGKTQVYIEAVRATLKRGRDAIILVPEIALTPQMVRRFRSVFQQEVAVLHSRMSNGERYDAWLKIRNGRARVVVGPRSAIFAPVQNLGLVVVDEEHESSYKQTDNAPRYHARDVAIVRARLAGATAILGSATPSMESYYNVRIGKYRLIEMTRRIDDIPMPKVMLVNMAKEKRKDRDESSGVLSDMLAKKIDEKLDRREQVIILQNRRGYASVVQCGECGHVEMCPNCNISMSYHLRGLRMRCHYCNESQKAPDLCPQCGSVEIRYRGVGTQKVERLFEERFPKARIVRMDLDTTRGRKAHDRILQDFAEYKYDILIGTQMVAKGLDFPRVTLVGVISADTGLYLPDFRASERTFQLLTQVAGRAGRKDTQGEVIIQTYSPDHICLQCAREHDFKRFFYHEMHERRSLQYPPFGRLALIQFRHENERTTLEAAMLFAGLLKKLDGEYSVLGPSPSPLTRLQNQYRFQIILKNNRKKDPAASKMRAAIVRATEEYKQATRYSRVRVSIDIDPLVIL